MKPEFYFYCYPWDLEDEGLDVSLGRLAGEIGVDGICVVATESEVRLIRARVFGERRTFACAAAAHFQPDPVLHRSGRIRPLPAAWMKSKNPLERISKVAEREGLVVRARVVCCEGAQLVARFPHAACINAFGDPVDNRLCPAHPDVREYVGLLVEDLSRNYPVKTIELAEFDFGAGDRIEWYRHASVPSVALRRMLSTWCFCSACRQRAGDAGVDSDGIRSAIVASWDALMNSDTGARSTADGNDPAGLGVNAYEKLRRDSVTQLVRSARARCTARLIVQVPLLPACRGTDVAGLVDSCDGIVTPLDDFEGKELAAEDVNGFSGPSRRDALIRCYPPSAKDGPSLISEVHRVSQGGFRAIGFEDYGLAPQACLDWVRQAIRYARREST